MKRIKILTSIGAVFVLAGFAPVPPPTLVHWADSMEAAREKAAAANRPILWFQLLGDLDEEFC